MKSFLCVLPVLGLVSMVSGFDAGDPNLADDAGSLLTYEATIDEDRRISRSPEPYAGSDVGSIVACLARHPDGTLVRVQCSPDLICRRSLLLNQKPVPLQGRRISRSPEPYAGSDVGSIVACLARKPDGKLVRVQCSLMCRRSMLLDHKPVPLKQDRRIRRSPEPYAGSDVGRIMACMARKPDGTLVRVQCSPELIYHRSLLIDHKPDPKQVQRYRRSPDPEPYKPPVGGGSGFQLPPGVTPFNPNARPHKRSRRSPQPGDGPGVRPPPNWRPPIRPIPRDPGRPWLQRRRRSSPTIIYPVYIYRPTPTPPPITI